MGSGGQRSIKSRAAGGGATTVAAAATSAASTGGGGTFSVSDFQKMSVDDQFNLVQKSIQGKAAGSYYTWDTDYQRFINNSGLDGAPNLVDDKTLDSMSGTETFRTTNENRAFPGKAIAVKTQTDDKLLYNAGGQEWYGKGLYSATSLGSSLAYGNNSRAAVMRFKVDDSKIVSTSVVDMWEFKESRDKNSLYHKLDNAGYDPDTRRAILTLSKGYTAIDNENGYITILTRKGVNMSKSIKQNGSGNWSHLKDYK